MKTYTICTWDNRIIAILAKNNREAMKLAGIREKSSNLNIHMLLDPKGKIIINNRWGCYSEKSL